MSALSAIRFTEFYHNPVFLVGYRLDELFVDDWDYPSDADAVLVYPYIDRTCGLTFGVLAPSRIEDQFVFEDHAPLLAQRRLMLLRRGAVPDDTEVVFPADTERIRQVFAECIEMFDTYYDQDERVRPTRNITEIDHLRHRDYPDDVFVVLSDENLPSEGVWIRLAGIGADGFLFGTLLNEPDSDYPVHEGDTVRLALMRNNAGEFLLRTTGDMLIGRC